MATIWTMLAKASVVPRAVYLLSTRINVKKDAFFVCTSIEFGVKEAFWHSRHIKLMQKIARVSLLTQASKPMLTNNSLITGRVSEWAKVLSGASILQITLANSGPGLVHIWER